MFQLYEYAYYFDACTSGILYYSYLCLLLPESMVQICIVICGLSMVLVNAKMPNQMANGVFVAVSKSNFVLKMEEGISVISEGKSIDIKQEKQDNVDNFKCEFDSGSQDSSKSGSGGYQRWAPNLNGIRKSAFTPYKSVQCTALTNLQRGDCCLLANLNSCASTANL